MLPAAVLNPHHAGHERTEDISRQLRAWSVVVLVGTQQHAESDTAVTVNRYPFHWSLNFGWRRGPLTNRSCGNKTLLGHSLPKEMLREVFLPSRALQGKSWRSEVENWRYGNIGGCKLLRTREDEEMRGKLPRDRAAGSRASTTSMANEPCYCG